MSLTPELDDYLYSEGLQPEPDDLCDDCGTPVIVVQVLRCPRLLNLDVAAPSRNGSAGLPTEYSVRHLQCVLELGHAGPHDWGSP